MLVKEMLLIKKTLALLLVALPITCIANTYYVSTVGNDSNPGSFTQPWLTWQKGFSTAVAGDTVFIRGGTYLTTITSGEGLNVANSGTPDNYICFFAYPDDYEAGNYPILDCSAARITFYNTNDGIKVRWRNYIHFKGLEIRNVIGPSDHSYVIQGFQAWNTNGIILENLRVHDIYGCGIAFNDYTGSNYIINCDTWNCGDINHVTRPGDYGTGIVLNGGAPIYKDSYGYAYGCRAWNCSDQGMTNGGSSGYTVFDNCWSFDNGKLSGNDYGMGHGFKYSYIFNEPTLDSIILLKNCISANNLSMGFDGNDGYAYEGNTIVLNSFSYNNGDGWENTQYTNNIAEYGLMNYNPGTLSLGVGRVLTNNLSYDNYSGPYICYGGDHPDINNSWNTPPGVTVTADDFQSLDYTQLMLPRKSDGSLPDITFGKLAPTSDCIDVGVDVGLPYGGTAPDLGWAEYTATDSTATDILTFTLADQTGAATINATTHTVAIEVAYTANITSLTPTLTLSYGATVIPLSGVARDFTNPVPYTVTALDGVTVQEWTVTVTQEADPIPDPPVTGSAIVRFRGKIVRR